MSILNAIAAKRDGRANSPEELTLIANGAADGSIPDYQLSAWLMAAYIKGLDHDETAALTIAMAHSGERLDLTGLPKPWLDKHSTGGVGDKTSLVVLPILAACGVTVVKMSGRGLGITGGTVDKLGSVPGFRLDLTPEEMVAQAKRIGIALSGQTPRLAPADGRLYALRDVTETVTSMPLIVSSILSKKIAGGAETVVFDVKCGSGAFMTTLESARDLAHRLVEIGTECGLKVRAAISDMDQPLGTAVGNALEVKEAIRVLKGVGPSPNPLPMPGKNIPEWGGGFRRFRALCVFYAGLALEAVGKGDRSVAEETLISGRALAKAKEWFAAQGGDLKVFEADDWCLAKSHANLLAPDSGYVSRIDARAIGQAVIELGGGRKEKDDKIDPSVGIELNVQVGDRVEKGQLLAEVHGSSAELTAVASAFEFVDADVAPNPVILETVG